MRVFGQVLSMDRANRVLKGVVDGSVEIEADYSSWPPEREPWPSCDAWFEQEGPSWRCVRPIGHRQLIFHDDFTRVASGNGYGDTPWSFVGSTGTAAAALTGTGIGVVSLSRDNNDDGALLVKDADCVAMPPGRALWLTARVRPNGIQGEIGFSSDIAPPVNVDIYLSSKLAELGHGAASDSIATNSIADQTFGFMDLLTTESGSMGWIDGSGPSIALSSSLAAGTGLCPFVGVAAVVGTGDPVSDSFAIDLVSLSVVSLPSEFAALAA